MVSKVKGEKIFRKESRKESRKEMCMALHFFQPWHVVLGTMQVGAHRI